VRAALVLVCAAAAGCGARGNSDPNAGAPPPAVVEHEDGNGGTIKVDHPERFALSTATSHESAKAVSVTGVVNPDVSRNLPVVSLASGRVVELRARLGDTVRRGQVLLRVQSADVSAAISDYKKAQTDEILTRTQLERSQVLFDRGAVAKKDLEVAQDTADKAKVDVENTAQRLRVLGIDPSKIPTTPTGIVEIIAPASGVITEQNITPAAGVKTLDNSPNLFTISDLSHVWIICDVFENDLPAVRVGDTADIHLTAYPDRVLTGRISNISAVLDPNIRTAKVRIEVGNPGVLRVGMFVTATFHGQKKEQRAVVPASAILHLHDRDWVYVSAENGAFRRQEVVAGQMLPGNLQELISGVQPGLRVVSRALEFQNTVEQ
jgi:membrane fusion protein, heavy metal efflux system